MVVIHELLAARQAMLEAVEENGLDLQQASNELRADRAFVLAAVKKNGNALSFASEELRSDREVVLEAVKQGAKQNAVVLHFASEALSTNREFVLLAVKQNAFALAGASEELRGDRNVVLAAVKQNGSVLQYASKELRIDMEVALAAVKQALQDASNGMGVILPDALTLPSEAATTPSNRSLCACDTRNYLLPDVPLVDEALTSSLVGGHHPPSVKVHPDYLKALESAKELVESYGNYEGSKDQEVESWVRNCLWSGLSPKCEHDPVIVFYSETTRFDAAYAGRNGVWISGALSEPFGCSSNGEPDTDCTREHDPEGIGLNFDGFTLECETFFVATVAREPEAGSSWQGDLSIMPYSQDDLPWPKSKRRSGSRYKIWYKSHCLEGCQNESEALRRFKAKFKRNAQKMQESLDSFASLGDQEKPVAIRLEHTESLPVYDHEAAVKLSAKRMKLRKVRFEFYKALAVAARELPALVTNWTPPVVHASQRWRPTPTLVLAALQSPKPSEVLANSNSTAGLPLYLSVHSMSYDSSFSKITAHLDQRRMANVIYNIDEICEIIKAKALLRRKLHACSIERPFVNSAALMAFYEKATVGEPVYFSPYSVSCDLSLQSISGAGRMISGAFRGVNSSYWELMKTFDIDSFLPGSLGTQGPVGTLASDVTPPFYGVRLKDMKALIDNNLDWFQAPTASPGAKHMKTMYDVCPELLIPATTCQERIVTIGKEDLSILTPKLKGGILVSDYDLTIDISVGKYVNLGGQQIPTGLTFHGKLKRGGKIRAKYWSFGERRGEFWKTLACHGRDPEPLGIVAPIPDSLPGKSDGPLGEASDRVWSVSELAPGDVVVLRKGISYAQLCAGGGPGYLLDSFASHYWGEETLDFYKTLEAHAKTVAPTFDPGDRVYYVCTFVNNQHHVELGHSWEDSPFNQALKFIASESLRNPSRPKDAVMAMDNEASCLKRKWCVFEVWRCTELNLPLYLFAPDGEINRKSTCKKSQHVMDMIQNIDLQKAECSVTKDANMINQAIEDAPGGFAAVHAKLRSRVLDLVSFMGSLAMSLDPLTGRQVQEIELQVKGKSGIVLDQFMSTTSIADLLTQGDVTPNLGLTRILLVAPAGSGKSVFTRNLVRRAVQNSKEHPNEEQILPIRVPLAELARVVEHEKRRMYAESKKIDLDYRLMRKRGQKANDLKSNLMNQRMSLLHSLKQEALANNEFVDIFDTWAKRTFLHESETVTSGKGMKRLLILDGFDEAAEARPQILVWLRAYLKAHPTLITVLTSRPSSVEDIFMSTGSVAQSQRKERVIDVDSKKNQIMLWPPATKSDSCPISSAMRLDLKAQSFGKTQRTGPRGVFPIGSYISVTGLTPPECRVFSLEIRLSLSSVLAKCGHRKNNDILETPPRVVSAVDSKRFKGLDYDPLNRLRFLKPGVYDNIPLEGKTGSGARAIVTIKDEPDTRNLLDRLKKKNKDSSARAINVNDLIFVEVIEAGSGYNLGHEVLLKTSHIPRWTIEDIDADLLRTVQLKRENSKDDDPDEVKRRTNWLHELKGKLIENVPQVEGSGDPFEGRPSQVGPRKSLLSVHASLGEDAEGSAHETLQKSSLQNFDETEFDEIEETDLTEYDLICVVEHVSRYMTLARGPKNEIVQLEEQASVVIDQDVVEVSLEQQLLTELSFSRLDVEPIDAPSAVQIIQRIGGEDFVNMTVDDVRAYPVDLWSRPLMANLFAQFLDQVGGENAKCLTTSLAEISVFRFVTDRLIRQAAHCIAKSTNAVEQTRAALVKTLESVSRRKLDLGERLLKEVNFPRGGNLFQHAIRGHIKLFEPQHGGTCIQFYHLSIQELLAAESWIKSGATLERAAISMSLNESLVQTGLAPLKFMAQATLERQKDKQSLVLNFSDSHRVESRLLFVLSKWIPKDLLKLSLCLPSLSQSPVCKTDLGEALGKDLQDLYLDFGRCGLDGEAFVRLGKQLPRNLRNLNIQIPNCHGINHQVLSEFAAELPTGIAAMTLNARRRTTRLKIGKKKSRDASESLSFIRQLPEAMQRVCFNFSGWPLEDSDLLLFGHLPKGLLAADIILPGCRSTGLGVQKMCSALPQNLKHLKIDVRSNELLLGGRMVGLGSSLPHKLESLNIVASQNTNDDDLRGLLRDAPLTLNEFIFDVQGNSRVTAVGITALAECLPRTLRQLTLKCQICTQLSDQAVIGIATWLPASLELLHLDFSRCVMQGAMRRKSSLNVIGNAGLSMLGKSLPSTLCHFSLNLSGSKHVDALGIHLVCSSLPSTLTHLKLMLAGCAQINDDALLSIGQSLPTQLLLFEIDLNRCVGVTDSGICSLFTSIPMTLCELRCKFSGLTHLKDTALTTIGKSLSRGLDVLDLDFSKCSISGHGLRDLAKAFCEPTRSGKTRMVRLVFTSCLQVRADALKFVHENLKLAFDTHKVDYLKKVIEGRSGD